MEEARAAAVDGELVFLARSNGRLRLRVGEALDLFVRLDGPREMGFSSIAGYALERLSRSGRWASETRTVARRMAARPLVREAFERGAIGWAKAEVVLRHAKADNEADLVDRARNTTVRKLREALRPKGEDKRSEGSGSDGDDDERRHLEVTVPIERALELEAVLDMVNHQAGPVGRGGAFEYLLAEATSTLFEHTEPGTLDFSDDLDMVRRTRRERDTRRTAEEPDLVPGDATPGEEPEDVVLPHDLGQLDELLVGWCAELAARDLWLGKMLSRFFAMRGWASCGYVSEGHYARERLGMSRSSAYERIKLARSTTALDRIAEAVQRGEIGFQAGRLLARLATRETEQAWVEAIENREDPRFGPEAANECAEETWSVRDAARLSTNAGRLRQPASAPAGPD